MSTRSLSKKQPLKKHIKVDVDKLIVLDDERLSLLKEIEDLRSQQNTQSDMIQSLESEVKRVQAISAVKELKEGLKEKEAVYKQILEPWQALMYAIPNIPDVTVPEGKSDADNVPIKTWGEKKRCSF